MQAIFDTGTSLTFVPKSLWNDFMIRFKEIVPIEMKRQGQYHKINCDYTGWPSIYF